MSITLTEPVVGKVKRIVIEDNGITSLGSIVDVSDAEGWNPAFQKIGSVHICPYELYVIGDTDFRIGFYNTDYLGFNYEQALNNDNYPFRLTCKIVRFGRIVPGKRTDNEGAVISFKNVYRRGIYCQPYDMLEIHNTRFDDAYYTHFNLTSLEKEGNITLTHFNRIQFGVNILSSVNVKNVSHTGGFYGFGATSKTIDGLIIQGTSRALLLGGGITATVPFKNAKVTDSELSDSYVRIGRLNNAVNVDFLDCQVDINRLAFYTSGNATLNTYNTQNLLSTTQILVFDEEGTELSGTTVSIYNSADEIIYSGDTDINGKIETILKYGTAYTELDGTTIIGQGVIDYLPFKIIVEKDGYETYKLQNTNVVEGEKTIIRAQLKPQKPLLIGTNGGVMLKLNPENTGDDRDLGILI